MKKSARKLTQTFEFKRPQTWKGKKRDEGNGGADGMVLSMKMLGDGLYSAIYTVPITVGSSEQAFGLQVDTGSSDMWIASTSCSSSACTANGVSRYNPSISSTSSGQNFQIPYLSGEVSGPIVWDTVTLGSYTVSNQALAGATSVVNETLQSSYSGIMGLALPINSVIEQTIATSTTNSPSGATFLYNLFNSSPAPTQSFMSILLERPGTSRVPSLLGVGRHPSDDYLSTFFSSTPSSSSDFSSTSQGPLTIDPSKVAYSSLVSNSGSAYFWKDEVQAITVYVDGEARNVDLGKSVTGSPFPDAVLDTGVPYIITTPSLANAIWGSLGIGPASDGNYYIPCKTPLNLTITLGGRGEIPLHPLDLTTPSLSDPSSSTCVGLIQQDSALNNPNLGVGDMILGVPFLRNVYSVLKFDPPAPTSSSSATLAHPSLGLLNITNPTIAMDEFHSVRVLNLPLDSTQGTASGGGHKLAVGLEVLFGLGGFVLLCIIAFVARWYFVRKKMRKAGFGNADKEVALADGSEEKGLATTIARTSDEQPLEGDAVVRPGWRAIGSITPSLDSQRTLLDATAGPRNSKHMSKIDPNAPSQVNINIESDGEESGGEADGAALMKNFGRRRREEEEGWRESWVDAYSMDQPALHGEWRPDSGSGSSPRPSLRELRLSSSDRRSSNLSATSSSHGLLHTPPHTPTSVAPLLPLETRLDPSLRGSTVESLSDYAIGLPPPSEFGLLGSRRGSIGDTMLGISATAPSRPRLHGRTSSGLRSSSMTNVISASDIHSEDDSTPHAL